MTDVNGRGGVLVVRNSCSIVTDCRSIEVNSSIWKDAAVHQEGSLGLCRVIVFASSGKSVTGEEDVAALLR